MRSQIYGSAVDGEKTYFVTRYVTVTKKVEFTCVRNSWPSPVCYLFL